MMIQTCTLQTLLQRIISDTINALSKLLRCVACVS